MGNYRLVFLSLVTLAALVFASSASAGEVHLSVAASLKEVIDELADGFARNNPGVTFRKNFGASGALAKQVENGAPVDIFISANLEWMEYLKNKGVTDKATVATFAYNSLVFAGDPALKVRGMSDLPRLARIAIGSPKSVPAGAYAGEAIKRAGLEKQLSHKLVMARDVRDCLMYAERGEVAGAFVYRTDAMQASAAKILFTVPQSLYPEVTYPMALTVAGAANRDAASFFKYLRGDVARETLRKYGFALK
ncbi:Molybdenum ABC transporter, substrate-binding protein ModA [Citrifermentans bremense]|uniref:Molybdenum ABC transporter, substrate-binding protein ModA n=1 Tax=Citrifermentans bremense TaxID=60035 RepID=A0A6S6LYM9_9BACT|nr:molybdate ABC transporter substrate-binding protein [Citrifermentans bremense]BCG46398.1 Molybdenum ABC transporter, substrate-binding protein ModA [Citrifermentans bremense]